MSSFLLKAHREIYLHEDRHSSTRKKPQITRVSRRDPLPTIVEALESNGAVIIKDFTDLDSIERSKREVRPWLDRQAEGQKVGALGGKTRTVTRLMSRSPTVRESFFADPLYQSLVDHFLTLETTHWYDENPVTTTSEPLLSIAITFDILPGTKKQGLHRDDKNHHWRRNGRVEKYQKGREGLVGLFVPACDTTKGNGATRVVLGSHLWGDEKPHAAEMEENLADAEMVRGEALVILGGTYHGGGEYGAADGDEGESRTVHAMFCCNGVSRQEEVSFLAYDQEEVRTWSRMVRNRLGWKWSEPNLGWVDLKSPEFLLNLTQDSEKDPE